MLRDCQSANSVIHSFLTPPLTKPNHLNHLKPPIQRAEHKRVDWPPIWNGLGPYKGLIQQLGRGVVSTNKDIILGIILASAHGKLTVTKTDIQTCFCVFFARMYIKKKEDMSKNTNKTKTNIRTKPKRFSVGHLTSYFRFHP